MAAAPSPPAGGRRERKKADNRAAILQAAQAVFGEVGYGAASVRDVVRRTDLAAGTFYNYFRTKEEVFRALVEETGREARRRVRAARLASEDLESFIADSYRAYFSFIASDPERFAFMQRNTGTIRALFDDVVLPDADEDLREDLRAAIARGDVPATLDVEYAAIAMTAVAVELGAKLLDRDPPDVEGATRFATGLFLGGLDRLTSVGGRPAS